MIARGWWQKSIYNDLANGYPVFNPVTKLRGRAKRYAYHYEESFNNLLYRMRCNGYRIVVCYGPRGGMYSARYKAYKI